MTVYQKALDFLINLVFMRNPLGALVCFFKAEVMQYICYIVICIYIYAES